MFMFKGHDTLSQHQTSGPAPPQVKSDFVGSTVLYTSRWDSLYLHSKRKAEEDLGLKTINKATLVNVYLLFLHHTHSPQFMATSN